MQADTQSWTFTASAMPPSPNRRLHWAERRRLNRPLCDEILCQLHAQRPPLLNHARITVTLTHHRGPLMDIDNAYASVKALVDCLKGRIIVNDDPGHIDLLVTQARGKRPSVSILVEAL